MFARCDGKCQFVPRTLRRRAATAARPSPTAAKAITVTPFDSDPVSGSFGLAFAFGAAVVAAATVVGAAVVGAATVVGATTVVVVDVVVVGAANPVLLRPNEVAA